MWSAWFLIFLSQFGIWLYHFLTNRSQCVRLHGGTSKDHPVISGVPQATVLGPLLFLIMIADMYKDVSASRLISFADDARLYSGVGDVHIKTTELVWILDFKQILLNIIINTF